MNEQMELTDFLYTLVQIFGMSMVRNVCAHSRDRTLNWLYLKNEQTITEMCMLIDIHKKIKLFLGGHCQKWLWSVWSWDSKIEKDKQI